jgi:hypothetical protein
MRKRKMEKTEVLIRSAPTNLKEIRYLNFYWKTWRNS